MVVTRLGGRFHVPGSLLTRVFAASEDFWLRRFIGEYIDDLLISMLGRGHCFDDISGIGRVVVAVVTDKFTFMLVGREKSGLTLRGFDDVEITGGLAEGDEVIVSDMNAYSQLSQIKVH